MVLRAADTHPATISLPSRSFMGKFHFLMKMSHSSSCTLCCSHLTPHTCPRNKHCPAGWAPSTAKCRIWCPKVARTSDPRHLKECGNYRKLGTTWAPRCLQWHGSVLATESPSSFPAVKMAFCESSTILLTEDLSRQAALDNRALAFHVNWTWCLGSVLILHWCPVLKLWAAHLCGWEENQKGLVGPVSFIFLLLNSSKIG